MNEYQRRILATENIFQVQEKKILDHSTSKIRLFRRKTLECKKIFSPFLIDEWTNIRQTDWRDPPSATDIDSTVMDKYTTL